MKAILKRSSFVFVVVFLFSFSIAHAGLDTQNLKEIKLVKGELETITAHSLTRVSTTDPTIADVVSADDKEVLLIGKGVGQVILFIWDEFGKHSIPVYVSSGDLTQSQMRIKNLLNEAGFNSVNLEISRGEGKIILTGTVPDDKKDRFAKLLEPFQGDIVNFVSPTKGEDLVQIDMQVTELNTTLSKTLGIDWTGGEGVDGSGTGIALKYEETLPTNDGSISDFFKIGNFGRTASLLATVNALVEEGKAHILSKPKLVVVSGQPANLIVGGEIPIRTTTTNGTTTQENVEFKEYGIDMKITPTIRNEKIDVLMKVDIRDLDRANAVDQIPAFLLRTAQTQLLLDDQQTVILAGLIKRNDAENVRRVPFLGNIPVVGLLFRQRYTPTANQDQELVISLKPTRIAQSVPAKQVQAPPPQEPMPTPQRPVFEKSSFTSDQSSSELLSSTSEAATQSSDATTSGDQNKIDEQVSITLNKKSDNASDEKIADAQDAEVKNYIQSIQQKIAQAVVYPPEAEEFGWEGTVKLGLLVLNDGSLGLASVRETSGYEIFDEYALETAKKLSPYTGFPPHTNLRELNITVPIVYSLKNN